MSESRKQRTLARQKERAVKRLEKVMQQDIKAGDELIVARGRMDSLAARLLNAIESGNYPLVQKLKPEFDAVEKERFELEREVMTLHWRIDRARKRMRATIDKIDGIAANN